MATMVPTIFDQPDAASVHAYYGRVVEAIKARFRHAATHLDDAREDMLAFAAFPHEVWRQIWSNNPRMAEQGNPAPHRPTSLVWPR